MLYIFSHRVRQGVQTSTFQKPRPPNQPDCSTADCDILKMRGEKNIYIYYNIFIFYRTCKTIKSH